MTTTVTIQAHCSADKHVEITIVEGDKTNIHILLNGEETQVYAYDSRVIRVREVLQVSNVAIPTY